MEEEEEQEEENVNVSNTKKFAFFFFIRFCAFGEEKTFTIGDLAPSSKKK